MKNLLFFTFMLLLSVSVMDVSAQTVKAHGVDMPTKLTAGTTELKLNGTGLREKYWIDLYVCGLYTQAKATNGSQVTNSDQPMAVRIHVVSSMITAEKMSDAIEEGFEKSMNGNTSPLQSKINSLLSALKQDDITSGDVFDLIYESAEGVKVIKNGTKIKTITGLAFKKALFGIWLGDDPVDKGVKKGMLGK